MNVLYSTNQLVTNIVNFKTINIISIKQFKKGTF